MSFCFSSRSVEDRSRKAIRVILSIARKAKCGVKQAAPGNYRTQCFVHKVRSEIVHPGVVPTNLTRVETFSGAAGLRRFPVMHASTQISRGVLLHAKRLPCCYG